MAEELIECRKCGGRGFHICEDCHGTGLDNLGDDCVECGGQVELDCELCEMTGSITKQQEKEYYG